ncbi:MAG: hypothetical protein OEM26_10380 [Saprospiraceae bacterium]|nr:hypothetical protein [Saprospiraceae bacterium]
MTRTLLLLFIAFALFWSCNAQKEEADADRIVIKEGTYRAEVNLDNVDPTMKGYHATSQISFGFEKNNTFIYKVRAMGREIDDLGKWEVRGDSLFIFDLERGPNTAFKLEWIGEDQYSIRGPNHFILTREDAVETIKQ